MQFSTVLTAELFRLAEKRNPVDAHVGSRLRLRRTLLGMSQEKLGEAVGLTFQQIQKYEKGANRVGASRLFQFARILDVPPAFFFDDMPDLISLPETGVVEGVEEEPETFTHDPMIKRETLEMVRAYYRIADPQVRKRIFEMIKAVANASDDQSSENPPSATLSSG